MAVYVIDIIIYFIALVLWNIVCVKFVLFFAPNLILALYLDLATRLCFVCADFPSQLIYFDQLRSLYTGHQLSAFPTDLRIFYGLRLPPSWQTSECSTDFDFYLPDDLFTQYGLVRKMSTNQLPQSSTSRNFDSNSPTIKWHLYVEEMQNMWNLVKVFHQLRTREQAIAFPEEKLIIKKTKVCNYHKMLMHVKYTTNKTVGSFVCNKGPCRA